MENHRYIFGASSMPGQSIDVDQAGGSNRNHLPQSGGKLTVGAFHQNYGKE